MRGRLGGEGASVSEGCVCKGSMGIYARALLLVYVRVLAALVVVAVVHRIRAVGENEACGWMMRRGGSK